MSKPSISMEEYQDHVDSYDGLCIACGEWSFGSVEPDAEEYTCEFCNKNTVMGAEQAMITDSIEISED